MVRVLTVSEAVQGSQFQLVQQVGTPLPVLAVDGGSEPTVGANLGLASLPINGSGLCGPIGSGLFLMAGMGGEAASPPTVTLSTQGQPIELPLLADADDGGSHFVALYGAPVPWAFSVNPVLVEFDVQPRSGMIYTLQSAGRIGFIATGSDDTPLWTPTSPESLLFAAALAWSSTAPGRAPLPSNDFTQPTNLDDTAGPGQSKLQSVCQLASVGNTQTILGWSGVNTDGRLWVSIELSP